MAQRQINKGFVHFFKLCTGKTAMHKDQQNKKTCNQFCKPITGLFSTQKCSCQRVINSDTCTYFIAANYSSICGFWRYAVGFIPVSLRKVLLKWN